MKTHSLIHFRWYLWIFLLLQELQKTEQIRCSLRFRVLSKSTDSLPAIKFCRTACNDSSAIARSQACAALASASSDFFSAFSVSSISNRPDPSSSAWSNPLNVLIRFTDFRTDYCASPILKKISEHQAYCRVLSSPWKFWKKWIKISAHRLIPIMFEHWFTLLCNIGKDENLMRPETHPHYTLTHKTPHKHTH